MKNVLMMGAGAMGGVLGELISAKRNATVQYWDKEEGKVPNQQPLEILAAQADVVFLCVSSKVVRAAAESLKPHLKKDVLVITIAKGVEEETGKTMDEVLTEILPDNPSGLLSGPMLADELKAGLGGGGIVAVRKEKDFQIIAELFKETGLRVEFSAHTHAVALTGVLKNVYALALGMAHGLGWGKNKMGWLFAEALKEMCGILEALNERGEVALGMAGIGDLVATGFSSSSRNHQVGKQLAEMGEMTMGSEGVRALPVIVQKLGKRVMDFRVLLAVKQVIVEKQKAVKVFEALL